VRPGRVDIEDVRYLPGGEQWLPAFEVRERDLLFTRYNGSLDLLGVCGIVKGMNGLRLLYPDKLMRIRLLEKRALPEYIALFFSCPAARERLTAEAKSSAGQQGISGKDLKAQEVWLPPRPEQDEIVRRVGALFALADAIEARAAAATARAGKLTQAILAKAFRGELVPTEAELASRDGRDFEPASMLLEQIRAARSQVEPKRVGRKRVRAREMR
jgi:type I restriction enzyme S subunit